MSSNRATAKTEIEPWVYQGRPMGRLEDFPEGTYGFIYEITHKDTNQKYIGKKQLLSYHKKPTRVFNEKTKRWNKSWEILTTESNWQDYFGSNREIVDLVKKEGKNKFKREIIYLCPDKKLLTFYELAFQCKRDVLTDPDYINSNILGKFFRSDWKKESE